MGKQIVFCADGTWNGPSDNVTTTDIDGAAQDDTAIRDGDTNVVKLFENLQGREAGTQALQNETELLYRDAAGNAGAGREVHPWRRRHEQPHHESAGRRVRRGRHRTYRPRLHVHFARVRSRRLDPHRGLQPRRLHGAGIGRHDLCGRFARHAASTTPDNKNEAYLRGFAAWLKCKGLVFRGDEKLSSLLNAIVGLAGEAVARATLRKGDLIPRVPIKSVGVWDTVGSMGIPNYVKGSRNDFFSFVDTKLPRAIELGFHAMALDEQRRDFPVTRWDKDARVEQVWFIGAHSDVGGGYPLGESGLSNLALDWMTLKLAGAGVRFAKMPSGPLDPVRFGQKFHAPWSRPPFNLGARPRAPKRGDVFHDSVNGRWQADGAYRKLWPKIF